MAGKARLGMVCRGGARHGRYGTVGLGMAGLGEMRHGRQGTFWLGVSRWSTVRQAWKKGENGNEIYV